MDTHSANSSTESLALTYNNSSAHLSTGSLALAHDNPVNFVYHSLASRIPDHATPLDHVYYNIAPYRGISPFIAMALYYRKVSIFHRATWYVWSDMVAKYRRNMANERQERLERRKEEARALIKNVLLDDHLDMGSIEVTSKAFEALLIKDMVAREQSAILAEQAAVYNILAENSRAYSADAQLNHVYYQVCDAIHQLRVDEIFQNEEQRQYGRLLAAERLVIAARDVMRAITEEMEDFDHFYRALANLAWDSGVEWWKLQSDVGYDGIPYLKSTTRTLIERLKDVGVDYRQHRSSGKEYFGQIKQLLQNERLLMQWLGEDWRQFQEDIRSLCELVDRFAWQGIERCAW